MCQLAPQVLLPLACPLAPFPLPVGHGDEGVPRSPRCRRFSRVAPVGALLLRKCEGPSNSTVHVPVLLARPFVANTLASWKQHNLLYNYQVDAVSCPKLFNIFRHAKKLLCELYQTELKDDQTLNLDFLTTELWLKQDANASVDSVPRPPPTGPCGAVSR